jgi:hypothetical protein
MGSIKCREFLACLRNYRLLKKDHGVMETALMLIQMRWDRGRFKS